jgi:excinuclease ABC subunit A
MTELNDHLKLFFARTGQLFDRVSARPVRHDTPESIYTELVRRLDGTDARVSITFPVELPVTATPEEVEQWLSVSGFTKVQAQRDVALEPGAVPTDRHLSTQGRCGQSRRQSASAAQGAGCRGRPLPSGKCTERARVLEAIEVALKHGSGRDQRLCIECASSAYRSMG